MSAERSETEEVDFQTELERTPNVPRRLELAMRLMQHHTDDLAAAPKKLRTALINFSEQLVAELAHASLVPEARSRLKTLLDSLTPEQYPNIESVPNNILRAIIVAARETLAGMEVTGHRGLVVDHTLSGRRRLPHGRK